MFKSGFHDNIINSTPTKGIITMLLVTCNSCDLSTPPSWSDVTILGKENQVIETQVSRSTWGLQVGYSRRTYKVLDGEKTRGIVHSGEGAVGAGTRLSGKRAGGRDPRTAKGRPRAGRAKGLVGLGMRQQRADVRSEAWVLGMQEEGVAKSGWSRAGWWR